LIGTPYEINTDGALLVLEDVDESPYRIDRMLTQLRMNGALLRAAGIIAGGWTNCGVTDELLRRLRLDPPRRRLAALRETLAAGQRERVGERSP